MDRSLAFASTPRNYPEGIAHFTLAFALAPSHKDLTLLRRVTPGLIMQEARGQAYPSPKKRTDALPQLVSNWFQVLFHSPNRGSFHLSLALLVRYRSQACT